MKDSMTINIACDKLLGTVLLCEFINNNRPRSFLLINEARGMCDFHAHIHRMHLHHTHIHHMHPHMHTFITCTHTMHPFITCTHTCTHSSHAPTPCTHSSHAPSPYTHSSHAPAPCTHSSHAYFLEDLHSSAPYVTIHYRCSCGM